MAEQQNQHQGDGLRRMGRLFGIPENVIDAGILAIVGTIWYKISGGRGNFMPSFGGTSPPVTDTIASTQADEGNLDALLVILEEGGIKGCIYAEHIKGMHEALLSIHKDYAKQFRNFFFSMSGTKAESVFEKLQKLFDELCNEDDDDNAWTLLSKSPTFPTKRAIRLCDEIEEEIDTMYPAQCSREAAAKKAYLIIARRMIDDDRLQGTIVTHTEEKFNQGVESINTGIQDWNHNQRAKRELRLEEESQMHLARRKWCQASPWKWMIILWIVLIFLIVVVSVSAPPEPKPETPLPGLSDKVSQKATGWIESLKANEESY